MFTKMIVSLVLQIWDSVAVMGGDKFTTHLTLVSISREKRKKHKTNDGLLHITQKIKNRPRRTPNYKAGVNVGF